ncbi:UNVERIFIED_ORG: hypothetical protein J3D59_002387 [Pseudomonas fluorescens]|uniref:Uncharacterized protein n=1 Tax=Pseudomonas salomonii TaxID=191391 RepID=A0A1H3PPR4_9PSED|nr:hypothetical protein [Pseudomonas sp. 58 R 3]SDZ02931.1 hypothetical protein SAMN05216247_106306 [Pseudomonas salomonii]
MQPIDHNMKNYLSHKCHHCIDILDIKTVALRMNNLINRKLATQLPNTSATA